MALYEERSLPFDRLLYIPLALAQRRSAALEMRPGPQFHIGPVVIDTAIEEPFVIEAIGDWLEGELEALQATPSNAPGFAQHFGMFTMLLRAAGPTSGSSKRLAELLTRALDSPAVSEDLKSIVVASMAAADHPGALLPTFRRVLDEAHAGDLSRGDQPESVVRDGEDGERPVAHEKNTLVREAATALARSGDARDLDTLLAIIADRRLTLDLRSAAINGVQGLPASVTDPGVLQRVDAIADGLPEYGAELGYDALLSPANHLFVMHGDRSQRVREGCARTLAGWLQTAETAGPAELRQAIDLFPQGRNTGRAWFPELLSALESAEQGSVPAKVIRAIASSSLRNANSAEVRRARIRAIIRLASRHLDADAVGMLTEELGN